MPRTLSSTLLLRHPSRRGVHHKIQHPNDRLSHIAAVDDMVDHSVLEQELASLETFRQFLPDRLLDHTRACKSDQCFWLGNINVTKHRKARGHAARGRVCEYRDERQTSIVQSSESRRDLPH